MINVQLREKCEEDGTKNFILIVEYPPIDKEPHLKNLRKTPNRRMCHDPVRGSFSFTEQEIRINVKELSG